MNKGQFRHDGIDLRSKDELAFLVHSTYKVANRGLYEDGPPCS